MIKRATFLIIAVLVGLWSVWTLESARAGLTITQSAPAGTPVTTYSDGSGGPDVVVAHGFAGSRQMMMGYATTLAQAGYTVHVFDFFGHGRHAQPMGGDVNSIDGTTRQLVEQTRAVIDAVRTADAPIALLGHSMATDVLVRAASDTAGVGPLVLVSAFSQAIDGEHPRDLLMISGAWEPPLRRFARDAVGVLDPNAIENQTVEVDGIRRRAAVAPYAEHVSVLHSRTGRTETLSWLNQFYDRGQQAPVPPTGWALLGLLIAITVVFAPIARLLPRAAPDPAPLTPRVFALAVLIPAVLTPYIAAQIDTPSLPVLVADYLALHLGLYGVLQIAVLAVMRRGAALGRPSVLAMVLLVIWGLGVFGLALDQYGASFMPNLPRLPVIAALALGAVPFMVADSWLAYGTSLRLRLLTRLGFLVSLALAIAFDFETLFFLILIAPVIVLFWLTYGVMGRQVARRVGPLSSGLALGVVLAWALGVTFPLFAV